MEEWRAVPDWPYEVSNQGRVRRTKKARTSRKGKVLKPGTTRSGHLTVVLCHETKKRTVGVHRLVNEVWNGPAPSSAHETAHLNGDPIDNRPENLVWATHRENVHHQTLHGTANFTPIAVQDAILKRLRDLKDQNGGRAPHKSLHQLAAEFNVPYHVVSRLSFLL